jgi:hypothetical protein
MLGMVEGNGHPFSWSAIINGRYDAARMAECGYPVIPEYLAAQPPEALGIDGAEVTHVWCDDPDDARRVADATHIATAVDRPTDVIGHVDAVIIPTDVGGEHVERARPFVDAGLPVFVDKPMVDSLDGLAAFDRWRREGAKVLSTSCMRYADEFRGLRERIGNVGEPRLITGTMCKSWERYGIHALEAVYGLLPPGGWQSVRHSGDAERNLVHLRHATGCEVVLAVIQDLYGGFGCVDVYGTTGREAATFRDSFTAFKRQLVAFIDFLRIGVSPVPWEETVEQMKIVIGALRSREAGGPRIDLKELKP